MKIKVLRTEKEYNQACDKIYRLIQDNPDAIKPDSPEGEQLEILSLLVEKYEQERFHIAPPDPIEAIKFRMDQMNLKQVDVAPLFGGETRVSEVLNGKRALTLKMISLVHQYLGIPLESLIPGNKRIKLEPQRKEQLLSISSIRDYLKGSGKIALL